VLLAGEMFQAEFVEKIKIYFMLSNFLSGNLTGYENVLKCGTAGQATDNNIK
jgi:hypothetical protein